MKWQFALLQDDEHDQHAELAMVLLVTNGARLYVEYAKVGSAS